MSKKSVNQLIENIIFIAIVLVLVQSFAEDIAVLMNSSWNTRKILIISGFCFDLFFSFEFLFRMIAAVSRREGWIYFSKRRGWVDLVASIPLLLFSSGPAFYSIMVGGIFLGGSSMLNTLKVIKAVRVARILRALRLLKMFKQIKYADSPMAQRHVSRIISLASSGFIFTIFFFSLFLGFFHQSSLQGNAAENQQRRGTYMATLSLESQEDLEQLQGLAESQGDVLIVKKEGKTAYTRYENEFYQTYFGPSDYNYVKAGGMEIFFDIRSQNRAQSRESLLFFVAVLVVILILLLFYSPHFAMTVTDPVYVMLRGMREKTYNLEVKIPEEYKNEDIYLLGKEYNDTFLPMKDRNQSDDEKETVLDIDMEDLKDFF